MQNAFCLGVPSEKNLHFLSLRCWRMKLLGRDSWASSERSAELGGLGGSKLSKSYGSYGKWVENAMGNGRAEKLWKTSLTKELAAQLWNEFRWEWWLAQWPHGPVWWFDVRTSAIPTMISNHHVVALPCAQVFDKARKWWIWRYTVCSRLKAGNRSTVRNATGNSQNEMGENGFGIWFSRSNLGIGMHFMHLLLGAVHDCTTGEAQNHFQDAKACFCLTHHATGI